MKTTTYIGDPDIKAFSIATNKMREFFLQKGFTEVHTQDRLSILAACEDPDTVATYKYMGDVWPLPQTGQMWLEYELLTRPEVSGVFCISTSYRNEPNPVPGRHKLIFPMFEFEAKGNINDLRNLEMGLLEAIGFGKKEEMKIVNYDDAADFYGVKELTHEHESQMQTDYHHTTFLEHFPIETSPFWNMKKANNTHSHKIDIILYGQETIGSAERAVDVKEMRREFETICDGGYAAKLYELFGEERVTKELEEYLEFDFFPRFGGGIGIGRMIQAMKKHGIIRNK